ncbi:MAG: DsbA family protein [Acidobacteriota bacterium]
MNHHFGRLSSFAALACLAAALPAFSQQQVPAAPPQGAAPAPQQVAPAAPTPSAAPVFPKQDPRNFTTDTPTKDEVNAFLHASWGYDPNRIWEVAAILKTPVPNLSKVAVYIGDKTGKQKPSAFLFFVLPDGKHIIAGDDVYPFGAHPYADNRAVLQQRADGPYRGAASKDLEMVEFADFECPHCKEAQANMDKLAVDFPKARIVFQNYPLERIHPQAKLAAAYGVCVTKAGGSDTFFRFAQAVFDGQEGLATADGATLTLNSAVTKVGLAPAKISACAALPATSQEVENSVKLAQDLNVNQTPTLFINGRLVPIGGVSYDVLKKIVEFQEQLDGIQP